MKRAGRFHCRPWIPLGDREEAHVRLKGTASAVRRQLPEQDLLKRLDAERAGARLEQRILTDPSPDLDLARQRLREPGTERGGLNG